MEEIFTDDSFYYFYSTVPQVLAGGIALIGVFAIFKIKALKDSLSGIAQNFYDEVKDHYVNRDNPDIFLFTETDFNKKINFFKKYMISLNFEMIKKDMYRFMEAEKHLITTRQMKELHLNLIIARYNDLYYKIINLRIETLRVVRFSAIVIITSLIIIPFGNNLPCWLVITLLVVFFVLVGVNLWLLINIIKNSI